jgi:hypothetical protein
VDDKGRYHALTGSREKDAFVGGNGQSSSVMYPIRRLLPPTVSITCGSAAHLDQFLQMGVDAGTSQTLDNLVVYVGSMKR